MAKQQPIADGGIPLPGVAGGAPQAGPPGGVPGPVAPRLSFAADPGMISRWLTMELAESTADIISDEIETFTMRYANLPAVGDPGGYADKLRVLAKDSLVTDNLSCYLTISWTAGQSPRVITPAEAKKVQQIWPGILWCHRCSEAQFQGIGANWGPHSLRV
jgi:hypothetical protein